jgi:transposase, IS30 family
MYLHRDSPAGLRLFASLLAGRSLTKSARAAGVGRETARRWVREAFDELRAGGLGLVEAQVSLGFASSLMPAWDKARQEAGNGRHHLRRPADVETAFWAALDGGASLQVAAGVAGVGRSTGYRWLHGRFLQLRQDDVPAGASARTLRLDADRAERWERERRDVLDRAERAARAARHDAIVSSAQHASALAEPRASTATQARHARYWQLIGQGHSNTEACKIMSLHPRTGRNIRRRGDPSKHSEQAIGAGRYLTLPERLQIADLMRHEVSLRAIAAELGRSASTISRELGRHRDEHGRYQPYQAEQAARRQRRRPRKPRLLADARLREVVQRKLNRYWSPEQISGWLRALHPEDTSRTLCAETIYQALIVPGARCLHSRYTAKLRTGRKLRRSHLVTRSRKDGAVRNMTMIKDRPVEVQARVEPGHWEGDLIIGLGSTSAMITLRERVTHYGIIVNLPGDHTALTVNAAVHQAFAKLPPHLARTLTWDQGTEMARHQDLAAATGLKIYFAERSSSWQRGANENFNGLARQFFPKNTDLSLHSHEHVNTITRLLNDRPRKTLGYQTPAARFRAASRAS